MKPYDATIETMEEEASADFGLQYAVPHNEGLASANTKLADAYRVSRGQAVVGEIGETSGLGADAVVAAVGAVAADRVRLRPPCGRVLRVGSSGVSDCESAGNGATETYQERAGGETVGEIRLQAEERRVWIVAGGVRVRGRGCGQAGRQAVPFGNRARRRFVLSTEAGFICRGRKRY